LSPTDVEDDFAGCDADGFVFACSYFTEGGVRVYRVEDRSNRYRVVAVVDLGD
jgi:hypothetical protein